MLKGYESTAQAGQPAKHLKFLRASDLGLCAATNMELEFLLGLPYRILNMNPQKRTTMEPMGTNIDNTSETCAREEQSIKDDYRRWFQLRGMVQATAATEKKN